MFILREPEDFTLRGFRGDVVERRGSTTIPATAGGSAEEKGWDRQRKFDRIEQRHFRVVMEALLNCAGFAWNWSTALPSIGQASGRRDHDGFDIVGIQLSRLSHPCNNFCLWLSLSNSTFPRDTNRGRVHFTKAPPRHGFTLALLFYPRFHPDIPEDVPLSVVVEPTRIFHKALIDRSNHEADAVLLRGSYSL